MVTIVLGMAGSGMNIVAGILQSLGLDMGQTSLTAKYYNLYMTEGPSLAKVDAALRAIHSSAVTDGFNFTLAPRETQEVYKDLIRQRDRLGKNWGIAEHGAVMLFHLISECCGDCRLINTKRSFRDCVITFAKNNALTTDNAILAVGRCAVADDDIWISFNGPKLEVFYEDLKKDSQSQVRRLAEFVGMPYQDAAMQYLESNPEIT